MAAHIHNTSQSNASRAPAKGWAICTVQLYRYKCTGMHNAEPQNAKQPTTTRLKTGNNLLKNASKIKQGIATTRHQYGIDGSGFVDPIGYLVALPV